MASKDHTLQPWVNNLLLNYERMKLNENILAGQVLRVLHDSSVPGQPEAVQDAVLQVSDGSYYVRVVITAEALRSDKNSHTQIRFSTTVCRIIVLQKYEVYFQEEARLEDCEFYLLVQSFTMLPMEKPRLESSDGNKEPSVMQKVKEFWLKSLNQSNSCSSEPCSQLVDPIRQNCLEVLKKSAEECLDLGMPKVMPSRRKDEVPVTQWEAERKQGQGKDTFVVPANILVVPPEERAVACDSSRAETSKATPRENGNDRMGLAELSVVSQPSFVTSEALSESLEESTDNPWDRLLPVCLTLSCSDENTKQDVAADSSAPGSLQLYGQDFSEGGSPGEPLQASSPLLGNYGNASLVETNITQAPSAVEVARVDPSAAHGLQISGSSKATPSPPSAVTPILSSGQLQALPEGMPHQEQADSSITAFPPDTLAHGLDCVRFVGGDALGARRKLPKGDGQAQLAHHNQQHLQGVPQGKRREMGGRQKPVRTKHVKKSRKEETGLQHGKELSEEEEEPAVVSGPSTEAEQHKVLQPYKKPLHYKYKTPSPELCKQIRSVRISKVMLEWACKILTKDC